MTWMILAAILLCLFIVVLYCALIVASDADDAMEIYTERVMTNVTPVPAPAESERWIRYPVPLDDELQKHIERTCKEYEIPSSVVVAVIGVESSFDPNCMGDNGNSFGLMQIYRECHLDRMERLGVTDLADPKQNVLMGIDYLAELIDWFDGDWNKALSFYNSDTTGKYASKVIAYAECLAESVMPFSE